MSSSKRQVKYSHKKFALLKKLHSNKNPCACAGRLLDTSADPSDFPSAEDILTAMKSLSVRRETSE